LVLSVRAYLARARRAGEVALALAESESENDGYTTLTEAKVTALSPASAIIMVLRDRVHFGLALLLIALAA
jgi:hypothetical protein